jgi:hypothetical protein
MKLVDPAEVRRILSNLSSMPGHTTTTDRATARELVSHEFVFCGGLVRRILVKHLGVGVYKVYTEGDE